MLNAFGIVSYSMHRHGQLKQIVATLFKTRWSYINLPRFIQVQSTLGIYIPIEHRARQLIQDNSTMGKLRGVCYGTTGMVYREFTLVVIDI